MSLYSQKPVLKAYQDRKRPEYIYEQNRLQLLTSGITKSPRSSEGRGSAKVSIQYPEHQDPAAKKIKVFY